MHVDATTERITLFSSRLHKKINLEAFIHFYMMNYETFMVVFLLLGLLTCSSSIHYCFMYFIF